VGVENGVTAYLTQAVAAQGTDVGVRPHQVAEVAVEAAHAADRIGKVELEEVLLVPLAHYRGRQEVAQMLLHADRSGSRSAAAVRGSERLVEVEVHDVEAHVTGTHTTHDGVEVRTVVVELRTRRVSQLGDLENVAFEQAERVRVGEHHRGDLGADGGLER